MELPKGLESADVLLIGYRLFAQVVISVPLLTPECPPDKPPVNCFVDPCWSVRCPGGTTCVYVFIKTSQKNNNNKIN